MDQLISRLNVGVGREWIAQPKTARWPDQRDDGGRNLRRYLDLLPLLGPATESGVGRRNVGEMIGDDRDGDPVVQGKRQPGDCEVPGEDERRGAGVIATYFSPSPGWTKYFRPGEGGTTDDRGGGKAHASIVRWAEGASICDILGFGVSETMIATGS